MSDRNTFRPRSRQFDEREITRTQNDFSGGLFKDKTAIPNNAVADLKNFVNNGEYLEGRGGSRLWGDWERSISHSSIPLMNNRSAYVLNKDVSDFGPDNYHVTIVEGDDFLPTDVGKYIIFYDDNKYERIEEYISPTEVVTSDTTTVRSNVIAEIGEELNGLYYHPYEDRVLIQVGSTLYVSPDSHMTSWTQLVCASHEQLGDSFSKFDTYDSNVFIFNSNGIFKTDLKDNRNVYYKINSAVPQNKITSTTFTDNTPYGRRYIYSMSRIRGKSDSNRNTENTLLEQESGTVSPDSNGQDWGVVWSNYSVGSAYTPSQTVDGLSVPILSSGSAERHWTHYSIYATADVGINGIDPVNGVGNNSEIYSWVDDVPIAKSFYIVSVEDHVVPTLSKVTISQGAFSITDIGSNIVTITGYVGKITAWISSTVCLITRATPITNVAGSIGAISSFIATQNESAVTIESPYSIFSATDVGAMIFWADGSNSIITRVFDGFLVEVNNSYMKTSIVGCINPSSRSYQDYTTDETLKSRLVIGYTCNQRFYSPLPNSNIGVIVPGFLITAISNKNYVNYSDMIQAFEYLAGYYYSPYQYIFVKDSIQAMSIHTDKIVVWSKNSRTGILTTNAEPVLLTDYGVQYSLLKSQYTVHPTIGIDNYSCMCQMDDGNIFFITNEPAIRIFDGDKDSENIADGRIMNDLSSMRQNFNISYDSINGIIFWGIV